MLNLVQRIIQIGGIAFVIFMVIGGGFAHRETLADTETRTSTFTLYVKLPPPPAGPSYCDVLDFGDRGLVLPCDYKPPFIGWLQGGKY